MKDKKILVVLTGGTIGSTIADNTINVTEKSAYVLINEYYKKYGESDIFQIEQPYNILSENTTLDTWTKLCSYLSKLDYDNYEGIIITHGTDTYSYTSALLGLLYDNFLNIPMILVSSNYAIGEPESNGLNNFANAVKFIKENNESDNLKSKLSGVFCIFEDNFGVNRVYKAREIMEADTCTDQFNVFGGQYFGHVEGNHFIYNDKHINHCMTDLDEYFSGLKCKNVDRQIIFNKEVINLKSYPGLNYEYINIEKTRNFEEKAECSFTKMPVAVINNAYHSATTCVTGENNSFINFAKKCKRQGINVYVNGFKQNLKDEYASIKELQNVAITKLYDMSAEMAYAYVLVKENLSKSK